MKNKEENKENGRKRLLKCSERKSCETDGFSVPSPAKRSKIPIRKHRSQTTPETGNFSTENNLNQKIQPKILKLKPKSPVVLTAAENKKRHAMKLRKTNALKKLPPISPISNRIGKSGNSRITTNKSTKFLNPQKSKNTLKLTQAKTPKFTTVPKFPNAPNFTNASSYPLNHQLNFATTPKLPRPKEPLAMILSAHELSHRKMNNKTEKNGVKCKVNSWSTPKKLEIKPELSLTMDRTEPWELMNDSGCPKQEVSLKVDDNKKKGQILASHKEVDEKTRMENPKKSSCAIC